jgi:hypothetical protein
MYLYSRRAQLAPGNVADAMGWATGIAEIATRVSGLPVQLWTSTLSPGVGTLIWSTWVPDLTALEAAFDKLAVDPGFQSAADAGAKFLLGTADDNVLAVLTGDPDLSRPITYVAGVGSVARAGKVAAAIDVGMKIAASATKLTGDPTVFGTPMTGPYGAVQWLTGYADIAALEAAQQKLSSDASWVKLIDKEAGDVYVDDPNLSTQLVFRLVG